MSVAVLSLPVVMVVPMFFVMVVCNVADSTPRPELFTTFGEVWSSKGLHPTQR